MQTIDKPKISYPDEMYEKPFFSETARMLEDVSNHDFDDLSQVCDDDFGIIDINVQGGAEVIRNREGWENWFKNLFIQLDQMEASTWSEITNYEAIETSEMGYGVVDFDQKFITKDKKLNFSVIATIIWKKVGKEWKESRYHSSLIKVEPLVD
jgi:hypothetical protein